MMFSLASSTTLIAVGTTTCRLTSSGGVAISSPVALWFPERWRWALPLLHLLVGGVPDGDVLGGRLEVPGRLREYLHRGGKQRLSLALRLVGRELLLRLLELRDLPVDVGCA